jgi:mannose-1-phosphate guanylyltransferase/mannose-6-phosphate isomerase
MARLGDSIHAVILAGGAGERFWPASRRAVPKPFLKVLGGKSLLATTLSRARRFADPERIWAVAGCEHAKAVRAETGLSARRVLVEPMRRNTAMAIAYAALRIRSEDPDAVMLVLPADHVIPDARAFRAAILQAARAAREADVLVTLGVEPKRPDTGLGYLQRGPAVGPRVAGLYRVRRFVEKPNEKTARRYLRRGDYLWNAGIFAWSARTILEELEAHAPDLRRAWGSTFGSRRRPTAEQLRRIYRRAPSVSIDVAVLERSRRVWTLPVRFHWNDVGTWASLAEELGVRRGRSRSIGGALVECDSGANLAWSQGRTIALLGVEGVAVIDTPDALLVARLDRSPDVRKLVAKLQSIGRSEIT